MKAELRSDEFGYFAEEISKESVKEAGWFLLVACSKMKKRDKWEGAVK